MVHFPKDGAKFERDLATGRVPFFRTLCDSASTASTTATDLNRVDCPLCAALWPELAASQGAARVAQATATDPGELELDEADLDDLDIDLDALPAAGFGARPTSRPSSVATPRLTSGAPSGTHPPYARLVIRTSAPSDDVLLARMVLAPEADAEGSSGFGDPDPRSAVLASEREPIASLLSTLSSFGFAHHALPIVRAFHRLCSENVHMRSLLPLLPADETPVEPDADSVPAPAGEDHTEE